MGTRRVTNPEGVQGPRYYGENRMGPWLEREMGAQGIRSAAELARALGTAGPVAWRWLTGKQRPSSYWCERIADVFGYPVDYVLELAGYRPQLEEDDDESPAAQVCRRARAIRWNEQRLGDILAQLGRWHKLDQAGGAPSGSGSGKAASGSAASSSPARAAKT